MNSDTGSRKTQDLASAAGKLEEADFVETDLDGVREQADDIPLEVLFQPSTNALCRISRL